MASCCCLGQGIDYSLDFEIYRTALAKTHPSLYRFTPKERFDFVLDSIQLSLSVETTEYQYFRNLSMAHAMIRESHSYVEVPTDLLVKAKEEDLFPFRIWMEKNRMIITESRKPRYDYLVGAEVKTINGLSIATLQNQMETYALLNSGFNNSAVYKEYSSYNNFAYAYYFYVDSTDQFILEYINPDNSSQDSVLVEGTNLNLTDDFPKFIPESRSPFHLSIDEEKSVAIMTITTFAYWIVKKKKADYLDFFEESFSIIKDKNINNLIIDVSNNRGGEELLAADLLTYFIEEDFTLYKSVTAKTLDFSYTNELPNSTKLKFSAKNYVASDEGYALIKGEVLNIFHPKKKLHFDGNIYFLSSGRSRSATNIFLSLARTHQVGTIVGQESGGTFGDLDGRWRVVFSLPYSGMKVSYPAWRFRINSQGGDPLRGVIPDYEIRMTNEEVLNQKNVALNKVYELIAANQ